MTKSMKVILSLLLLAIAIRVALPHGIKWYVNKTLDEVDGYQGHIDDVDLAIWRGAYRIEGVVLEKIAKAVATPFVKIRDVDLSLSWDALFHGNLVGEIVINTPEINFVDGESEKSSQSGTGQSWQELVQSLMPIKINRFAIANGEVHFRNFTATPPIDVWLKNISVEARNLSNASPTSEDLFATVTASADGFQQAKLKLEMKLDPFADKPTFDLNTKLTELPLAELNDFFKEYISLDFAEGVVDIVLEVAAKKGRLDGYVKPLFRNLDVLSMEDVDADDSIFQLAWEGIVGAVTELLENQSEDQFATRVSISGDVSEPNTDVLALVGSILRNAFVRAFQPVYDQTVSLGRLQIDSTESKTKE